MKDCGIKTGGKETSTVVSLKKWMGGHGPVIFLLFFYTIFHIALSPSYWDDANYRKVLDGSVSNLLPFLYDGYRLQTSRTTIEFVIGILSLLPYEVWKALDLLIILLLYKDTEWFLKSIFNDTDSRMKWGITFLLCSLPFSIMACAGWMATTTNYLWVISLGWYAVNKVLKYTVLNQKLSVAERILTMLAVLYSGCFESVAILMMIGMITVLFYEKYYNHKKISGFLWGTLLIIILLFVEILVCPGNQNRLESDAGYWMTDYAQMGLLDKLRMGIVTAFMHFVSVPSPVFFMVSGLCLIAAIAKKETVLQKVIAAFPLLLDVVWTCYYMMNYLVGKKTMTYQVPDSLLTGGLDTIEQLIMLFTVALWFTSFLFSLFRIFEKKKDFVLCTAILLIGCVPEVIVGMSATVVNSMLRTVLYLYLSFILVILCMWKEVWGVWNRCKWFRTAVYLILASGIALNALQMARHILIYG